MAPEETGVCDVIGCCHGGGTGAADDTNCVGGATGAGTWGGICKGCWMAEDMLGCMP